MLSVLSKSIGRAPFSAVAGVLSQSRAIERSFPNTRVTFNLIAFQNLVVLNTFLPLINLRGKHRCDAPQ